MPLAAGVRLRVPIDEPQASHEARVRFHEDVVAVPLRAVLGRIAAAGAAGLAVELHAADVAGPGSFTQAAAGVRRGRTARKASRPSVRTVRAPDSSMRSA